MNELDTDGTLSVSSSLLGRDMPKQLEPGLVGEARMVVSAVDTAIHVGSGQAAVLATPVMVRLMEQASVAATTDCLEAGQVTVGVHVDVQHLAATPVGFKVMARAKLVQMQGRKLTFEVEAWDDQELIGRGTHERVVVGLARFQARADSKKQNDSEAS